MEKARNIELGKKKLETKKIIIFICIVYILPWIFAWCVKDWKDTSSLAAYMMILPTSGVAIAKTFAKEHSPKEFYMTYNICFAVLTVLMIMGIAGLVPEKYVGNCMSIFQAVFSLFLLAYCCLSNPEFTPIYNGKKAILPLSIFVVISMVNDIFVKGINIIDFFEINMTIAFGFIVACISFIGEEFAWREVVQKKFQQIMGKRAGVLLLGIVWELWHMPLWFTTYSLNQQGVSMGILVAFRLLHTTGLAVFIGWAYMRSGNIWLCAMIHFLNNLSAYVGDAEEIVNEIEFVPIIFTILLFLPLFTKEYRKEK